MDLTKLSAAKLWIISSPPTGAGKHDSSTPRDLPYLSTALYSHLEV